MAGLGGKQTMRVEVTEKRLSDSGYLQHEGDVITVPDEIGTKWCRHGWAKDVDGNVQTGKRIVRGAVVQPDAGKHGVSDTQEG